MNCFVDYRVTTEELNNLIKLEIDPIIVPKSPLVYPAIDGHVDIQIAVVDKCQRKVVINKDIDQSFINILKEKSIDYLLSQNSLSDKYPKDIILNGFITDEYFIHNLNYTDPTLLKAQQNKKLINVKQGYTKCSILPISDNVIITNDLGIYNSLDKNVFDILLVPPGDILLPSLNYGFIGGVGGMISKNKLALFGELEHYQYGSEIYNFLYKYDVEPIYLRKGKLIDRGSLLLI